jgi:hypothetical protein
LKEARTHLRKERVGLQPHHEKQLARLRFFEQALGQPCQIESGRVVPAIE